MRIVIVTPAGPRSLKGNRITALRWARLLRELGHRVQVEQKYDGQRCELLIALHARRSAASVARFHHHWPERPIVLALTGTDLYRDLQHSRPAQRSVERAWRLVLLQPHGLQYLPERHRHKARVIFQSMGPVRRRPPLKSIFEVCVIGHLRPEKDPFRAAMAARRLPAESRIQIRHLGAALSRQAAERARREMARNPRYRWLGLVPRWQAVRRLARSRLLVISSRIEGGAGVLSEALAACVPVLSSRISGCIGLLGEEYPGYFEVGDTIALAELMLRAERDRRFYRLLESWCRRRRGLVRPARERASWKRLLSELG